MDLHALPATFRAGAGRQLVELDVRGWKRVAVAAMCAGALVGVLALDEIARPASSFGALTVIPVAFGAWLLADWTAIAVVTLGLGIRVVGVALGGVDAITAAADIGSLLLVAVAVSSARRYLTRWRVAQAALQSEREKQAALAERERIAAELPAREIHVLFRLTLELQAAATDATDQAVRSRIATTIEELDELIRGLRGVVYSQDGSEPDADAASLSAAAD